MKKRKISNVLLILIPAFWACLVDLILTIMNQPFGYWQGNLQIAEEGNPLIKFLMKNNISGIFIFVTIWLLFIVIIGYYLPTKLLRMLSIFVLIAHTYGGSSWLAECCGFWTVINYILLNSVLFIAIQDIYTIRTSNIWHRQKIIKPCP